MKRIVIPEQPVDVPLQFYLAVEEWVAMNLPADEYFFAWQVNPTVICGRHQDIPVEVNLDYAGNSNINITRRKSGGGAVYADRNNVMFSYITPSEAVQTDFRKYTDKICRMLASLGIYAEPTGRNDISINGSKVAGNAFLKLPGRSIVHGTMLYDADFDTISKVLTPSLAKRLSKGVVSVPSRITTLKNEGLEISCSEFMCHAVEFLCDSGSYTLQKKDIAEVNEILETYFEPRFLRISSCKNQEGVDSDKKYESLYFDGTGEIGLKLPVGSDGCISSVELYGDFLHLKDIQSTLSERLTGLRAEKREIMDALGDLSLESMVVGLTHDKFEKLLHNI